MKYLSSWGIGQRIFLMKVLSVITLIAVIAETYLYGAANIERELEIQGKQLTGLLADSAEYGVVSGNADLLGRQLEQTLARNKNVFSITILDSTKRILVHRRGTARVVDGTMEFSEAILLHSVPFNAYDLETERVSTTAGIDRQTEPIAIKTSGKPVGFVNVQISRSAVLNERQFALFASTGVAALLLLMNVAMAYWTTRSFTGPLLDTIEAVRSLRVHKELRLRGSPAVGEIGELQTTLAEMAEGFFRSEQSLESMVTDRTAALADAHSQLEKLHADTLKLSAERRMLLHKVTNAAEAERRSIAMEIHDELNASLIVARLETQSILESVDLLKQKHPEGFQSADSAVSLEAARSSAAKVLDLIGDLYKMARSLVKRLRPEAIDTLGLVPALEEMVTYYDKSHPDCYFELNSNGDFDNLSDDLALSIYRIIQESLSNVIKYAEASIVQVMLGIDEEKQRVLLRVTDNGKGFDVDSVQLGLGLIGMRERVSGGEGELTIASIPGKGATISAFIPLVRKTCAIA